MSSAGRHQARSEGNVHARGRSGQAAENGPHVTLEVEVLGNAVELVGEAVLAVVAGKLVARELVVLVERPEEGMDALGRRQHQVDVKVETCRHLADLVTPVVVEGNSRAQVAIGTQPGAHQVVGAHEGVVVAELADLIERIAPFDQRTRGIDGCLAAVDVPLRIGVVGLLLIDGIR